MGNYFCIPRKTTVTPEEQLSCLEMKAVRMKTKLINYNEVVWAWKPSEDSQSEFSSFRESILSETSQDIKEVADPGEVHGFHGTPPRGPNLQPPE